MMRSNKASFAVIVVSAITWIYFEDGRRLDAFLTMMSLNLVILFVFKSAQYDDDKVNSDEIIEQLNERITALEKDVENLKRLEDAFFTHTHD